MISMVSSHTEVRSPLRVQPPTTISFVPITTTSCEDRGTGNGGRASHLRVFGSNLAQSATENVADFSSGLLCGSIPPMR